MRILFLSDLETAGGAGIAASRLANGLALAGVGVLRFFGIKTSHHSSEPVTWEAQYVGLPRAIEVGLHGLERVASNIARGTARMLSAEILLRAIRDAEFDILHVHAIHNSYWRHDTLARLPTDLPTVWTFHDCWGFSPESHRFRTPTGDEIRLKPDGSDRAAAQVRRNTYFHSRRALRLVGNSQATAAYARASLGLEVQVIPCGLPLDLYQGRDRAVARQALAIPADAFVLGFSADSGSDPVKGYPVFEAALRKVRHPNIWAIAIGSMNGGERTVGAARVRQLGRVDNPLLQAIVYSASDAFVMPSLAEGLGQVAMEAIACGTPVVGSNVGGIPDVVIPGISGWLVRAGDSDALAAQLQRLAEQPELAHKLTGTSRGLAEQRWDLLGKAREYREIYQKLMSRP